MHMKPIFIEIIQAIRSEDDELGRQIAALLVDGDEGRAIELLIPSMQNGQAPPLLRCEAGRLLGCLGWVPEDLETFIGIPRGNFLSGVNKTEREIAEDYWIGKYPVTNGQYARFVADRGYERAEFWSQESWGWWRKRDRTRPYYWSDEKWSNPLFPVLMKYQDEARAYCAWLTLQFQQGVFHMEFEDVDRCRIVPGPGMVGAKVWQARLSTDGEWERAARGTDGRRYSWGDDFDPGWANTSESQIKATTAVVTYPQGISPTGVWDMIGNVWEWVEEEGISRGGCWISSKNSANCTSRRPNCPGIVLNDVGMRVVLV